MLLSNTTSVVLMAFGLMTFGLWQDRDSGKAVEEQKTQRLFMIITLGFMTFEISRAR